MKRAQRWVLVVFPRAPGDKISGRMQDGTCQMNWFRGEYCEVIVHSRNNSCVRVLLYLFIFHFFLFSRRVLWHVMSVSFVSGFVWRPLSKHSIFYSICVNHNSVSYEAEHGEQSLNDFPLFASKKCLICFSRFASKQHFWIMVRFFLENNFTETKRYPVIR